MRISYTHSTPFQAIILCLIPEIHSLAWLNIIDYTCLNGILSYGDVQDMVELIRIAHCKWNILVLFIRG
jgi:hypothetical protein